MKQPFTDMFDYKRSLLMEPKTKLHVGAVQFNSDPTNKVRNIDRMREFVKTASLHGCDIISFPEICITSYNSILYTGQKQARLEECI